MPAAIESAVTKKTAHKVKPASSKVERQPGPYAPQVNGTPHAAELAPARINGAGLVHFSDAQAVEALPIHYYAERSKWYGPNGQGGFSQLSASQAASLIAEHGFNRNVKDPQGNTAADRALADSKSGGCLRWPARRIPSGTA
jgi:hypothetical protein